MKKFALHLGRFYFSPSIIPTLATLFLLPILIYLGIWQIHRAEQKQIILTNYESHRHAPPLDLNQLKEKKNINYYAVTVTGHFDNAHQFLIDNKFYQHQLGYQVLTPFILNEKKNQAVLINRGWIPQGVSRAQLPVIVPIKKELRLKGVANIPVKSFSLGENAKTTQWPKRINEINISQLAHETGYDFYPFVILLDPSAPHGFAREWAPINISPSKSYGYAFQWFALAVALLVIYIAVNTKKS